MPQSSILTPPSNLPSPSPYIEYLANHIPPSFFALIVGHTSATDLPSHDGVSHGVDLPSLSVVAENPHSFNTSSLKPKKPFSMSTMGPTLAIVEPSFHSQSIKDIHWHHTMSEEYNALIQNGTWELVPPSSSQNIIGYKWVSKIKLKLDGSLNLYKERLVAKRYHQRLGLDFADTFSPVVKLATI
ncbi:hypothetical protein RDI58_010468 [Solanum bulbocastanum]|uniref:Reverse transcriptase Ty1/copia-type domain-containing protein n=1 Tax=Solanum bulbocastanum TaxID=147425 RepID=A0AAN8TU16_SOLBU